MSFKESLTSVEIVQTLSPEFQKPFNSQAPPKFKSSSFKFLIFSEVFNENQ